VAYRVLFKPKAEKQFDDLRDADRRRIAKMIDGLTKDARPRGAKMIEGGNGLWRLRSGRYRVVYAEPDDEGVIWVLKIGHRKDVYRGL
jgi:mRNA interferase RelE/StbE